jgi:hypothetical protein
VLLVTANINSCFQKLKKENASAPLCLLPAAHGAAINAHQAARAMQCTKRKRRDPNMFSILLPTPKGWSKDRQTRRPLEVIRKCTISSNDTSGMHDKYMPQAQTADQERERKE